MASPSLVDHRGQVLAVAEAFVTQREIPQVIGELFDRVYDWLPGSRLQSGHNVAVYNNFGPGGMRMRAGVQVNDRFASTSSVTCFELPPGRAAMVTHRGSYAGLHDAQAQLVDWLKTQSLAFDDMSWEVYGDWFDDESRLTTDIFVAVR